MGAAALVGAAATIGTTLYTSSQNKKAANKATKQLAGAEGVYEKIDLDELQALATRTARENALKSLSLEKELAPGVSATRSTLQDQVSSELAQGGKLSPDVINAVTRSAQAGANNAGLYGGAGPITAAMLGLTAMDVANARKDRATQLLAANPEPVSGLDVGSIANAYITDQTNLNKIRQNVVTGSAANTLNQANINSGMVSGLGTALTGLAGSYFGNKATPATTYTSASPYGTETGNTYKVNI